MERSEKTPAPQFTAETRVGEILTRWPQLVEVLVAGGLAPLADPAHRELVKGLPVTLGMACASHGLDLDALLKRLNAALTAL
jgi:hypothetical protein